MEPDGRTFPVTQAQLGIWLWQQTGRSAVEWQVGQFLIIDGVVDPDLIGQSIRQVIAEAEPLRVAFSEIGGRVFQTPFHYPDFEIPVHDLRCSQRPVQEAYRLASTIQQAPMSPAGPLFRFALFQTQPEEFYLFICVHHLVLDGFTITILAERISSVYSALAAGKPVAPAYFGSLEDLVRCESNYEASSEYSDDEHYWRQNIPSESGQDNWFSQENADCDSYTASVPVQLDPDVLARVHELSRVLGIRQSSIITAACALLVGSCCIDGSEVVLDFPVSRRTTRESKFLPGMLSGVLPLVLKASSGSGAADFCRHVDLQIQEALRHQRFPVHTLDHKTQNVRNTGRVSVNFIPAANRLTFNGAAARAFYTTVAHVDYFGLYFIKDDDGLFLRTVGAGRPFSDFGVADLAARLERVLVAVTADPGRRLSSVDVVGVDEHARLVRLPEPEAANLAYLIYTSGTTGTPKAVAITHHNITELFAGLHPDLQPLPGQVWAQCHSHAFDVSVWEMWSALLHGGRLVIVPDEVTRSPTELLGLLADEGVRVLCQTPSAWYALQAAYSAHPKLGSHLRLEAVVVAGEALDPPRLKRWWGRFGGRTRLVNAYGPTEATVYASFRRILEADIGSAASPIGVPLSGAVLLVLDRGLRPVPVGVVGELYVAG
ncbi:hypothetical protein B1T52_26285, partial [Mycobacterium kansasii]